MINAVSALRRKSGLAVTYASLRCADGFTAVMLMGVVGLE